MWGLAGRGCRLGRDYGRGTDLSSISLEGWLRWFLHSCLVQAAERSIHIEKSLKLKERRGSVKRELMERAEGEDWGEGGVCTKKRWMERGRWKVIVSSALPKRQLIIYCWQYISMEGHHMPAWSGFYEAINNSFFILHDQSGKQTYRQNIIAVHSLLEFSSFHWKALTSLGHCWGWPNIATSQFPTRHEVVFSANSTYLYM